MLPFTAKSYKRDINSFFSILIKLSLRTKHYNKLIFLFLFFIGSCVYGQNEIDSLQNLLGSTADSVNIEVLNELSKSLNHTDPKNSLKYAIEAKQLASDLDHPVLIAKSINYIGVSYYYLNELDLSNESYFEALTIFDSADYKPGVAKVLNNIAWNYKIQNLPDKAIEYFKQSLAIAIEIDDDALHQGILNNLGTVYRGKGAYDQALRIYNQSLEMNQKTGNKQWEAYNLSNIGMIYFDTLEYGKALFYFQKAKKINEEYNYTKEYTSNLLNIGGVYMNQRDFHLAEQYFNEADSIIEKNGFLRQKLQLYGYKRDFYSEQGNFKEALRLDILYYKLNMELNQIAWNEKVSELQTKYDLAQKGRELEIAERKVNQQRFVIIGGTSFFLLLLGILLLVIKLYNSKNLWAKNIEKLNEEIKQKNEELQTMNEEVKEVNNNLEQLVEDRTTKIKNQNEKLVKYAFINSHEIRGPLARVLGLLYLMGLEKREIHEDESFNLLKEATNELDDVIKGASEILEGEDITIDTKEEHS